MKKALLLISVVLCFVSCQEAVTYQTVKVKNYSLDVPNHLSEVNNLNDDASLQYQNAFKELYVIVIDETKREVRYALAIEGAGDIYSDDFGGYTRLMIDNLKQSIPMKNIKIQDTIIHSLDAKIIGFNSKVEEYDVFYKLAFINGIENYYQIMSWTLLDKKQEHEKIMDKMIYSFKVKNKKKYAKPIMKK